MNKPALLVLVLLTGWAHADNKQAARDAYKEGSRLYDVQDYRGALEAFKKAYVNYEEPTLLFNIAQCQRYLGQKSEAVVSYRNFLRKAPTSPMADEVRRLITQLEGAIEQERKANSAPPTGTLSPGTKSAEAKPAEAKPPETRPAKPAEAKPAEPAVVVSSNNQQDQPLIKKWWLWTAVGGGVLLIALGVGLGVGLSSHADTPYPSTGAVTIYHF